MAFRPGGRHTGAIVSVELVILVDDSTSSESLRAEHGLAVHIAGPGRRLLLDAGAGGEALLANARALEVDLAGVDSIILSHGHYDHTGGLAAAAAACRHGVTLYAHPTAWRKRWADRPGKPLRDISCPHPLEDLCRADLRFQPVQAPQKLEDWLVLSGPIGGPKHGREIFVVKREDDLVVDGFEDEMFCLVRGERGWAVVTGCCHRGLKNTLRMARLLAHDEPVVAVLGGLHLRSAPPDELASAAAVLHEAGSPEVYPCHCTGQEAVAFLAERMPGKVHPVSAGKRIVI